ncbi:unnamed protein product [Scytosiphon promiscuus]
MHTAAGAGALESIELLLSAGLSPKTRDQHGRTPLHLAAGQGSAQCVAFLCAVARSTVISRDEVTGDTPLHFAVRARQGVCIEVLLSHARGRIDILRQPNTKGETPFCVAAALDDDNALFWALKDGERRRRRRHSDSDEMGRRLRSKDDVEGQEVARRVGIDFERIMAVWERFFENAAATCDGWDGKRPRASTATVGEETERQRGPRSTWSPEDKGWWKIDDQSSTSRLCEKDDVLLATSRKGGSRDVVSNGGEAGDGRVDGGGNNLPHIEVTSTMPRRGAWTATPPDLVRDGNREDFDRWVRGPVSQQQQKGLRVRVGSEQHGTSSFSSHDADLHLFHTPREHIDGETASWPDTDEAEMHSSSKPSALESNAVNVAPGAATDAILCQQAWVACWDPSSGSIYYWNSDSGEVAWDGPSCIIPCGEKARQGFPNRVWDPQQEAFFTVDERGVSHWLLHSNSPTPWVGAQPTGNGIAGYPTNPATEQNNAGADDGDGDDDVHGFYDARERSCRHVRACSSQASAEQAHSFESTDDARFVCSSAVSPSEQRPRPSLWPDAATPTSVANGEESGQEQSSSLVDFFDPETYHRPESLPVVEGDPRSDNGLATTAADHASSQLPAWVMWCETSHDEDPTPYFVNEETGTSSWVLPPEAVVASRGWVRAWSEEHRTWFYANQWTGRKTWDLQDTQDESWSTSPDDLV